MPFLANDRLDPKLSHGDISIILEAGHNDTVQFALRQLMRRTRRHLTLRWMIDGYARGIGAGKTSEATTPRNLLGFKDGTANLDVDDGALMDRHVWVQPGRRGTRMGGRRLLSSHSHHQDVRRVLGPDPARRAGGTHRSQEGQRRAAGHDRRVRRSRLRRGSRRQADPARRPHPAGQPSHHRDRAEPDPAPRDSTIRGRSTAPVGSTRGWRSSPTNAACRRGSSPCRAGSRASRSRSTSCRWGAASSLCCRGLRVRTGSSAISSSIDRRTAEREAIAKSFTIFAVNARSRATSWTAAQQVPAPRVRRRCC